MKRQIVAVVLLLSMMVMLCGCNFSVPFLSKPEDALEEFMTQDSLMEVLSRFDDISSEDVDDIATAFWVDVITSPSIKSLLLDNVRTISYSITNTSINGNRATITALITHYDMSPIIDCAFEIFYKKVLELDASGVEVPEDEDELMDLLMPLISQSIREAVSKTKPTETYTKVRFDCVKDSSGYWELKEIPDDFLEKVLLMNFYSALEDSLNNLEQYEYRG